MVELMIECTRPARCNFLTTRDKALRICIHVLVCAYMYAYMHMYMYTCMVELMIK